MRSAIFSAGIIGLAALVGRCLSSPAPIVPLDPRVVQPLNELSVRDPLPMEVARAQYIEKRLSADFSLEHEWNNEVLFGGAWIDAGDHDAESVALEVTCLECWTKGIVTAKLTTEDLIMPVVRLDFEGVEAYVKLEVVTSASATYAINLFSSADPLGLGFPGLSLGLVFHLDLVFTLSADIDLVGGFYVKLADDAFIETSVLDGLIIDSFFDGLSTKSIPITVKSGSATFKAALRLRVQCGAEIDGSSMLIPMPGIGGGAVVGIYANIIEFVAVLDSTPTCALQTREWFDLNVGAYARLGVVVDFKTIGLVPTVSTTLLNSPTFTQCWIDYSPHETGGYLTTTADVSGRPPHYSQTVSPPSGGESFQTTISTIVVPTASLSASVVATTPASSGHGSPSSNTTSAVEGGELVTSTVYSTTIYTITSCGASVINCPASWQKEIVVTKTVDVFTTVCPPGVEVTFPTTTSSPAAPTLSTSGLPAVVGAAVHVVTEVVVLSVCPTPVVETFAPPTSVTPPSQQHITVVIPAPTTATLPMAVAETKSLWSNVTASYPLPGVAKPTVGGVTTSSPPKPAFTAGAGRPLVGGSGLALAVAILGLLAALQ